MNTKRWWEEELQNRVLSADELIDLISKVEATAREDMKSCLLEEVEKMNKAFPLREDNPQYSLGQTNGWFLALEEIKEKIKHL